MTPERFRDRREAGRLLAAKLTAYANRADVVVLALPRGGVPIAYKVAQALNAPLDVFVVRKLGVPGYEELAMGAVATGGVRVLNDQIVQGLSIPDYVIDRVSAAEREELARRAYRGGRPPLDVQGRTVILVDDGLATGATMRAAVLALRQLRPDRIIERAIGVIYRPETKRASHYFQARLADQFDAVLHFDETRAVEPLEYTAEWETGELPETFPFAV
jgi:predicted phosphoribosyltransferase